MWEAVRNKLNFGNGVCLWLESVLSLSYLTLLNLSFTCIAFQEHCYWRTHNAVDSEITVFFSISLATPSPKRTIKNIYIKKQLSTKKYIVLLSFFPEMLHSGFN